MPVFRLKNFSALVRRILVRVYGGCFEMKQFGFEKMSASWA